ncbi:Ku protein [Pseudomonas aeruginosa]|nr:Ku protein [Pseudomonas aeruginosa]
MNKVTGKEIERENIVKGVEYEKGRYVVLSEEEIRAAHPKSTQTIEIFAFVDSQEIPLQHFDTPYYLAPDRRGGKVYALLRETLERTGKVALANVVLHTRQHLALLRPLQDALVLITLRWPSQVRSLDGLELDESVTEAKLDKRELEMAKRLVEDMASHWEPDEYKDSFSDKIMKAGRGKGRQGPAARGGGRGGGGRQGRRHHRSHRPAQAQPAFPRRRRQGQGSEKAGADAKGRAKSGASRSRRKA